MTANYFENFMTKEEFNKEAKASLKALKTVNLAFYPIKIQHNPLTNQVNIPRPVFGLALTNPCFMAFLVANLIRINPKIRHWRRKGGWEFPFLSSIPQRFS